MHPIKTYISLLSVALLSTDGLVAAETEVNDQSVSVAFTFSMPPYLSADNKYGIERDIIHDALLAAGYKKVHILNVHYLRAIELAKSEEIDAIVSNKSNTTYSRSIPGIIASDKTIDYVDCAITLKSRNLKLDSIDDYYDKRIWAFKSASQVLGKAFNKMSQANKTYSENFDQLKQLDMLAMERIDIAISDRNIFSAKLKNSESFKDTEFSFHNISPVTPRVIRSTNKNLIDNFNKGLKLLETSGRKQKILKLYTESYAGKCES